jgi:hypothetical protein
MLKIAIMISGAIVGCGIIFQTRSIRSGVIRRHSSKGQEGQFRRRYCYII